MFFDLHVHSKYSSDGLSKPATLAKMAAKKGIGLAITDHNNCSAWPELKGECKKLNVPLVLGEEIKVTRAGKLMGEVLALFLNTPITERDFDIVLDNVISQGALIAAAHPFDKLRKPYFKGFYELPIVYRKLDAIETFNSRTIFNVFNKKAEAFAKSKGMPEICGSDAHSPKELGNAVTEVEAETVEEAMKEIKAGRTLLHRKHAPLYVHAYSTLSKLGLMKKR